MYSEILSIVVRVAAASCVLLLACAGPSTGPTTGAMKYVPLTCQMNYFSPAAAVPDVSPAQGALSKTAVKINPDKIMVLSMQEGSSGQPSQDAMNYDTIFWAAHNNQRNIWENQVAYFQGKPGHSITYVGELTHSGNYATGSVGVLKGENHVLVGFIMPGDTLSMLADAWYYWGYSYTDPGMGYTYTIADGWYGTTGNTPRDTLKADSLTQQYIK
jgi:hypothetical protein